MGTLPEGSGSIPMIASHSEILEIRTLTYVNNSQPTATTVQGFLPLQGWWWLFSRSAMFNSSWPRGRNPPGSSVHEIFQARILEWVAISFSRESSQPRDQTRLLRWQADCRSLSHRGSPPPAPHSTISNCNFAALLYIGPVAALAHACGLAYLTLMCECWMCQIMRLNAPQKFSPYEVPIDWSQKCSVPESHYFLFMNNNNNKNCK